MAKNTNNQPSLELLAARFAYAGTAVVTLGEILSTIAAGITLKVLEQNFNASNPNSNSDNDSLEQDIEQMQNQIDALIRELRQIKKMIR